MEAGVGLKDHFRDKFDYKPGKKIYDSAGWE